MVVTRDEENNYEAKVPIITSSGIQQVKDSFNFLADGISSSLSGLFNRPKPLNQVESKKAEVKQDVQDDHYTVIDIDDNQPEHMHIPSPRLNFDDAEVMVEVKSELGNRAVQGSSVAFESADPDYERTIARAEEVTNIKIENPGLGIELTDMPHSDISTSNITQPSTFAKYIDAFNAGIDDFRNTEIQSIIHPLDTIQNVGTTIWDGYNALTDVTIGISTEGSRRRNAQRGAAINDEINNFTQGDGPTRVRTSANASANIILGSAAVTVGFFGKSVKKGIVKVAEKEELRPETWGSYRPERELPRDLRTKEPIPDVNRPHTQIGEIVSKKGYRYTQARVWGYDNEGKLVHQKDIDFTDHGYPDQHPNPHQHRYVPNATGGTLKRSDVAEPLSIEPVKLKEDISFRPKKVL